MWRFSLLSLLLLIPVAVSGQCPQHVTISSQAALDNFIAQYPDCENIPGNLNLSGDLTDLTPLSNIVSVGGTLGLGSGFTTLSGGLPSLVSVGRLAVFSNTTLISFAGLENLTEITGDVQIQLTTALQSFEGLDNLIYIGGDTWLRENQALTSLAGLENLTTTGGNFFIEYSPALASVSALTSLTTVGGDLQFTNCQSLATVDGINALETVVMSIYIGNNASLTSITGFESLTKAGHLSVYDNPMLGPVTGFRNVTDVISPDGTRGWVFIYDCDSVALDALQAVETNVEIGAKEFSGCEYLTTIGGNLYFGTEMADLPDFPELTSIGGMFVVDQRDNLEVLDGFNKLETIGSGQLGQGFRVYDQAKLIRVSGFSSLTHVEGNVDIRECHSLSIIEGFESLTTVNGSFVIRGDSALTDCSAFCDFLKTHPEDRTTIFGNGPDETAGCWSEDIVRTSCAFDVRLVDVNPNNYPEGIDPGLTIDQLTREQVMMLDTIRQAVAADGATKVVLRIEMPEEGRIELPTMPEGLALPWTDMVTAEGDRFFAYVLYTAPETFDPGEHPTYRYKDTVLAYDKQVSIDFIDQNTVRSTFTTGISILRPPVVLVHSAFDNPEDAWQTAVIEEGVEHLSFQRSLELEGYKVFAVDYTSTNESSFRDNRMVIWQNPEGMKSALDFYRHYLNCAVTQADVVGHGMGGILPRVYASTSPYYTDGQEHMYKRPENFQEGDINRVITIATMHFGSHLAELQVEMANIAPFNLDLLDWFAQEAWSYFLSWYTGVPISDALCDQRPLPGVPPGEVNPCDEPPGEALMQLGATEIPAHAITGRVDPFGLINNTYDPEDEYYNLYWYTELMLYYNTPIRERYLQFKADLAAQGYKVSTTWDGGTPEFARLLSDAVLFYFMIDDAIKTVAPLLEAYDGEFELPSDMEILDYAFGAATGVSPLDIVDPFLQLYAFTQDPVGVIGRYVYDAIMPTKEDIKMTLQSTHDKSIAALRSVIFNNDANDGVVRIESQRGEIDKMDCTGCYTDFEHILHGFAPRYPAVQDKVKILLAGGMDDFNESGFPASDHAQCLYLPLEELDLTNRDLTGGAAICRSGMVPEHARAFARVADRENVVIVVRPVNPDATDVIAQGAATKAMDIKPKSSNWGPQRGYLPIDQRYSKIWKLFKGDERTNKIDVFNQKVLENLTGPPPLAPIAGKKQLQVTACNGDFLVYIDQSKVGGPEDNCAEDEIVLVPVQQPHLVCYWGDNLCNEGPDTEEGAEGIAGEVDFSHDDNITDCEPISAQHMLMPFEVMATVGGNPDSTLYMTADYDILMIGLHIGEGLEYSEPARVDFRPLVGQLTPAQEELLDMLNAEVDHYGGKVVHHGPENQYDDSPYIDYPLTAFSPDGEAGTKGDILSIRMGDPGFRDINLKRYVNRMRAMGYDLYDNPLAPGWKWEWNESLKGFVLEDHPELGNYVEEVPGPKVPCDKLGHQAVSPCYREPLPDIEQLPAQEGWLGHRSDPWWNLTVYPSPASSFVEISCETSLSTDVRFVISDTYGNILMVIRDDISPGKMRKKIDVGDLEAGMYTVTLLPGGLVSRFVRL